MTDRSISFVGCNSVSIPFEARDDGTFRVTGGALQTKKFCVGDNDPKFIEAITSADRWDRDASGIYFTKGGKRLVSFEVRTATPIVTSRRITFNGKYNLKIVGSDLAGLQSEFSEKSIGFVGCNSVSISYEAFEDGTFRVVGNPIQTLRACSVDNDSTFVAAIKGADRWEKDANGIYLLKGGKRVVSFDFRQV